MMERERITEETQTTTEVTFHGDEKDPKSIFGLLKGIIDVLTGKRSLREVLLGNNWTIKRVVSKKRTFERESLDGPQCFPRENLEDGLREDTKATLQHNAVEAEKKRLEAGMPPDAPNPAPAGETIEAMHNLAEEIEELRRMEYEVDLEEIDEDEDRKDTD